MNPEQVSHAVAQKPEATDSEQSHDHKSRPSEEPQAERQALLFCLRCGAALPGGVNTCCRCKAKVCVGCGE